MVYTNTQIINELRNVYSYFGRPYSRREYDAVAAISKSTVETRFGTWTNALKKASLYKAFTQKTVKKKTVSKTAAKKKTTRR